MTYNALFGLGQNSANTNLRGYWKLQETSGNCADSSGNSITGTPTGLTSVSGPNGWLPNALDFNSSTRTVNLGDIASIAGAANISVSFWFKLASSSLSNDVRFFGQWGGSNSFVFTCNSNKPAFATSSNLGATAGRLSSTTFSTIGTSDWHHIVGQNTTGTNTWTIYLDGTAVTASWFGVSASTLDNSTNSVFIGAISSDAAPASMAGVSLMTSYLSSGDVSEIQNGPEPIRVSVPTLSISTTSFTGTIGSWDSQGNGTITYAWEMRDADDDSVIASGTGSSPSGSGSYSGDYYLWVRATNTGGYDSVEDNVSVDQTASSSSIRFKKVVCVL